jgi:D-glycerate 3-kinase
MNKLGVVESAIEFVKPALVKKLASRSGRPVVLGIEGPQGSGKTTASLEIKEKLLNLYPSCNIVQFSMDDFYLTYNEQQKVNLENTDNVLLQGRGLPGTHDIFLLYNIFTKLTENNEKNLPIHIPVYDKSAFNGKGDRLPIKNWTIVDSCVDLIIFEGWFNGYPSITDETQLLNKWNKIKSKCRPQFDLIKDIHIKNINKNLQHYEKIWNLFDLFVCIKTTNIANVYTWRLQQEHDLIKKKGIGMTDPEVENFINRYMPIYYLYYDRLEITQSKIPSLELNIDISRVLLSSKL